MFVWRCCVTGVLLLTLRPSSFLWFVFLAKRNVSLTSRILFHPFWSSCPPFLCHQWPTSNYWSCCCTARPLPARGARWGGIYFVLHQCSWGFYVEGFFINEDTVCWAAFHVLVFGSHKRSLFPLYPPLLLNWSKSIALGFLHLMLLKKSAKAPKKLCSCPNRKPKWFLGSFIWRPHLLLWFSDTVVLVSGLERSRAGCWQSDANVLGEVCLDCLIGEARWQQSLQVWAPLCPEVHEESQPADSLKYSALDNWLPHLVICLLSFLFLCFLSSCKLIASCILNRLIRESLSSGQGEGAGAPDGEAFGEWRRT